MGGAVTWIWKDRRASRRKTSDEIPWLSKAKLRPGLDVAVIDLSRGGVLVETHRRLLPGARVVLQLLGPQVGLVIPATVLRCCVVAVLRDRGVRYRGALAFDKPLDANREGDARAGYAIPDL